jgi:hypothetical protein
MIMNTFNIFSFINGGMSFESLIDISFYFSLAKLVSRQHSDGYCLQLSYE